ncbi:hypothetical protein LCGC14_1795570, partial [marine sediment metagenome]
MPDNEYIFTGTAVIGNETRIGGRIMPTPKKVKKKKPEIEQASFKAHSTISNTNEPTNRSLILARNIVAVMLKESVQDFMRTLGDTDSEELIIYLKEAQILRCNWARNVNKDDPVAYAQCKIKRFKEGAALAQRIAKIYKRWHNNTLRHNILENKSHDKLVHEIELSLLSLPKIFGKDRVCYDMTNNRVRVKTKPITLTNPSGKEYVMGRYVINIPSIYLPEEYLDIDALDPNYN